MQRLIAEEFMAQVLEEMRDLSPDLRKRLLEISRLAPATRVKEYQKAIQEASRG